MAGAADVAFGAYLASPLGELYAVRGVRRRLVDGRWRAEALVEDCAGPSRERRHVREAAGSGRRTCVLGRLGVVVDVDVDVTTLWVPVGDLVGMRLVRRPE